MSESVIVRVLRVCVCPSVHTPIAGIETMINPIVV